MDLADTPHSILPGRNFRLFIAILALLLVGLFASIYLTDLFVLVHGPEAEDVDSFCAVNDRINCVTVANSRFSTVWGIPVSLYGVEFYLLGIGLLFAATFGLFGFNRWDSLLFDLAACSIPVCITLGVISTLYIRSVCLLCLLVYLVNLLTVVILGIVGRKQIGRLVLAGPVGLVRHFGQSTGLLVLVILVAAVALTQFLWVPKLFEFETFEPENVAENGWQQMPSKGLTLGTPSAPIHIEEFTDYQCPYCSKAHYAIMRVVSKYPDKIFFRHRDYPLDNQCNPYIKRPFHQEACQAALLARCAARQDQFWAMDALLFQHRNNIDALDFTASSYPIDLDIDQFEQCLADPSAKQEIVDDIELGRRQEVSATPTLFVNGLKIEGYKSEEFWENKIRRLLQPPSAAPNDSVTEPPKGNP